MPGEWFFTSDLHGQTALYEQLLAIAAAHRPGAVLIGGDLAAHAPGEEGVHLQRVFLEGFLVEFARRLREAHAPAELLLMMGNDDWAANIDCLERHHGALWHSIHGRAVRIGDTRVAGTSWVPITPFVIKDWERWDDGGEEQPARLAGLGSREGRVAPLAFDPADRRPTIAAALDRLGALGDPAGTVLVSHSPPRDTRCDLTAMGTHVGSRALRGYIERHQPPLLLSGHIHESPRVSGSDPLRPDDTVRHTVYG